MNPVGRDVLIAPAQGTCMSCAFAGALGTVRPTKPGRSHGSWEALPLKTARLGALNAEERVPARQRLERPVHRRCARAERRRRPRQSGAEAHAVQTLARQSTSRAESREAFGVRAIHRRSRPPAALLTRQDGRSPKPGWPARQLMGRVACFDGPPRQLPGSPKPCLKAAAWASRADSIAEGRRSGP